MLHRIAVPMSIAWRQYGEFLAFGARSREWPAARRKHLLQQPACQACGRTRWVSVHHIEPFHVRPSRELDPANLLTLCESGPGKLNCHLVIGHRGNWTSVNPHAVRDAAYVLRMLCGESDHR